MRALGSQHQLKQNVSQKSMSGVPLRSGPRRTAFVEGRCNKTGQRLGPATQPHQRQLTVVPMASAAPALTSSGAPVQPPADPVDVSYSVYGIAPNVKLLHGVCRAERLKYEVEYGLKRGTSDNSYLITSPSAKVLVDVPYEAFAKQFLATLEAEGALSGLTHIVITQLDPKAIPSLEALLARLAQQAAGAGADAAKPQVVLSNPALRLLQSTLGENPDKAPLLSSVQLVVARSGQMVAPCGPGEAQLQAILAPTPRWPDLLVLHDPENRLLLSSKLFSAHVVGDEGSPLDEGGWEAYGEDWKYFFDCMLAPVARQTAAALDKLDLQPARRRPGSGPRRVNKTSAALRSFFRGLLGLEKRSAAQEAAPGVVAEAGGPSGPLPVCMLLPMHGPVVDSALTQLLVEYRSWTEEQIKAAATACAAVLYASAYGNTAALAQAISRGITKGGVGVETLNLELASLEEVSQAIQKCDGFVLGSPTLGGHMPTQVSVSMGAILREPSAKAMPCGVFGSFGWSGEAVDEMEGRLRDAGFGFAFDAIRVKFKPTAKDLLLCEESGRALAQSIKKKIKTRELAVAPGGRALTASGPQLAMGRVVGSLCVVTAKDEDASSAMLASWVSQASFDPPGITVSVKKDRAMGQLLVVGGKFAVSMVAEGRDRPVMKRLTKPFSPGEDRLAGLDTISSPTLGFPVLKDANSWMECTVTSRMEAGDHIVIYAQVLEGKVLDENSPTAVHHRKVGNHY